MDCSTPGFPVLHQLQDLTQTHVHRVTDAIQQSHPLLSPSPPAFNLSQHQGLFRWVSSLYHVAKITGVSVSSSVLPSSKYLGLISFRMEWLDLLEVQGILKSLLQHHSSKVSILQHCFLCSPTLTSIHDSWKNHNFDQVDLCWQKKCLCFLKLSSLVTVFLPRSKHLSISWLQ